MSPRRGCYFNSERYLRLFKQYTEVNCYTECLANYTLKICGCVPFALPRLPSTKICGLAKENCLIEAQLSVVKKSLLRMTERSEDDCDCKPPCVAISYDFTANYSPADGLKEIYEHLKIAAKTR